VKLPMRGTTLAPRRPGVKREPGAAGPAEPRLRAKRTGRASPREALPAVRTSGVVPWPAGPAAARRLHAGGRAPVRHYLA
jgi:hypothetical protein